MTNHFNCPHCNQAIIALGAEAPESSPTGEDKIPVHSKNGTGYIARSERGFSAIFGNTNDNEEDAGIPFVSELRQTARQFYGERVAAKSEIRYFSNGADKQEPTIKRRVYKRNPQHQIDPLYEWGFPLAIGAAASTVVTLGLYTVPTALTPTQGILATFAAWLGVGVVAYREIQKRVTGEVVETEYYQPQPKPDVIQKVEVTEHIAKLEVKEGSHSTRLFDVKLPIPPEKAKRIAQHLKNGGNFSAPALCPNIISDYKFRQLVKALKQKEMAYVDKQVTHLRAVGKALFKSYLENQQVEWERI